MNPVNLTWVFDSNSNDLKQPDLKAKLEVESSRVESSRVKSSREESLKCSQAEKLQKRFLTVSKFGQSLGKVFSNCSNLWNLQVGG